MYRIALQMLFGDRSKYRVMVFGVAFAALIMTQQPSILIGLLTRTYSVVTDMSLPDIWVMDQGVQFVEEHKPLRNTDLSRVRGVPGILWAVPLFKAMTRARMPDGSSKTVDVSGLDDATLIGAPPRLIQGTLTDLRRADAIFVDYEAAQTRLRVNVSPTETRPLNIGDVLEINDKRAVVIGYAKCTRNFVLQPQVFTTYSRALSYSSSERRKLTYILVKAKEGQDLDQLCQMIEKTTGLKAYTSDAFKEVNLNYWMKSTGIPINFGISVLLGFIVGAAIVGQTFFSFVRENTPHYAALKAMGTRPIILAKMVILQALVVGGTGYGLGVGLTTLFGLKAHDSVLAFRMPPSLLIFSGLGILAIISLAAFISVRRIIKVDPSVVFRGGAV